MVATPCFDCHAKRSPVVKVAIQIWSGYLGVCGAMPSPTLLEMLDLHASLTLIMMRCHVDIFSTLPCSRTLSFGNEDIYVLSFNVTENPSRTIELIR